MHWGSLSTALQQHCLGQQLPHHVLHICNAPSNSALSALDKSFSCHQSFVHGDLHPQCCCAGGLGQLFPLWVLAKFNIHGTADFRRALIYQPPFISLCRRLPSYLAPSKSQTAPPLALPNPVIIFAWMWGTTWSTPHLPNSQGLEGLHLHWKQKGHACAACRLYLHTSAQQRDQPASLRA